MTMPAPPSWSDLNTRLLDLLCPLCSQVVHAGLRGDVSHDSACRSAPQVRTIIAKRLRGALGSPVTANEHANGYGTVCLTGHPLLPRLWLQCVGAAHAMGRQPERALIEEERDVAQMPLVDPRFTVPWLPMVIHRVSPTPIYLTTRMWVLDELRWLSQRDALDSPRTSLDTFLSKINHGEIPVVLRLDDLTNLLKAILNESGAA